LLCDDYGFHLIFVHRSSYASLSLIRFISFCHSLEFVTTGGTMGEWDPLRQRRNRCGGIVELAGIAGTDLSGYVLYLYNGANGAVYDTIAIPAGAILPNENELRYGAVPVTIPGIQNGAPDGICLVHAPTVVQFLSYEGTMLATDGPCAGQSSTDIGVAETGTTPIGSSLQLIGSGTAYQDFSWTVAGTASPGSINTGQTFAGNPPPPPMARNVVINEIDSDTPGTDAAEFVELYDGGVGNTDLTGLFLVLWSNDAVYKTIDLTGQSTNSAGFFVVGSSSVPNLNLVDFTTNGVQNGATTNGIQNGADAVALYEGIAADFPAGALPANITATNATLLDAIVYDTSDADDAERLAAFGESVQYNEDADDAERLAAFGESVQYNEDANGNGANDSLSRVPDGTGAFVAQLPTPGATNVLPAPPTPLVTIMDIQGA
jgi:uncharacterized protein